MYARDVRAIRNFILDGNFEEEEELKEELDKWVKANN